MRYFIHLIAFLALLLPSLAEAYDVLIVQSSRSTAYQEALKGFRNVYKGSERLIVLSDYSETDIVRIVREDHPRLVLALGDRALKLSRDVRQAPVIALMALGIHDQNLHSSNITGVGMFISPRPYLALCKQMNSRRVGVIYHSSRSAAYLRRARQEAGRLGLELVLREVRSPQQTMSQLASLAGKVDTIWMLPDSIAVTRESIEAFFRFSQEKRVPLVSFAGAYLGLGAAAVLELDRDDLGRQAGEMAALVLKGNAGTGVRQPRKAIFKTNHSVLKTLGITLEQMDTAAISTVE